MQHSLMPVLDDRLFSQVNRHILDNATRCPRCNAHQSRLVCMLEAKVVAPRYIIGCKACGHRSRLKLDLDKAIRDWNYGKATLLTRIVRLFWRPKFFKDRWPL